MNVPFPDPPATIAPTAQAEIDRLLERLADRKSAWQLVPIDKRIEYLTRCKDGVVAVASSWALGGCRLKGISTGDPLAGEEWIAGPMQTARNVRLLIEALRHGGQPRPARVTTRRNGQRVARVFPMTLQDRLMFGGFTADVWIEPGKPETQGAIYRDPAASHGGRVSLVLGAGNVSSIAPMDALYKLFVENEVVLLKMNPVNEHVGPRLEEAFRCLVDDGFLAIVYGGADVGAYVASHPKVDALHVTGSDRTYDAIVWGADPAERERRKAAGDPRNARPFTAELGCVTPILVVPGPWSASDIEFQARHVAGMIAQNASFNCNAAKVLVTAKGWLQRDRFLEELHSVLAKTPPRKAYYPGAHARYEEFLAHYPKALALGARREGAVPWTAIPDVSPESAEYALTHEAFCGVIAEVSLDASSAPGDFARDQRDPDPARFLRQAVRFANERCWGTLSCGLIVHPSTARDHAAALDQAVEDLRYGGIGINCWPAVVYGLVSPSWGAFPGHTPKDIQSGTGVVHNAFMFDHPQKSVVVAPFRIRPTPVWFPDNQNLEEIGKRMVSMEAEPSWGKLVRVALAAMKG